MKVNRAKKPLLIVATAIVIATAMIMMRPQARQTTVVMAPLPVDVLEVYRSDLRVSVQSYGEVLPRTRSTLTTEVSGKIISVDNDFVVGGFFSKGDELLKIDDRRYRVALKRSESELARAQSLLAQERGRAYVAKQQWQQRKGGKALAPAAKGLALREPQLQEALANLESARANLQQAKDDLTNTVIRAPFDGLLREKYADVGRFVSVNTALAQLFAVDYAEVRLPIPEFQLDYLALAQGVGRITGGDRTVLLSSDKAAGRRQWQAQLVRTEGVLDQRSRVLHVVARIDDPYRLRETTVGQDILRIGSFVEAEISGRSIEGLIAIPADILRPGNLLWVVDDDNRLQQREVSVLRISGRERYVSQGLVDGDKICLTSVGSVLPGRLVVVNSMSRTGIKEEEQLVVPAAEATASAALKLSRLVEVTDE